MLDVTLYIYLSLIAIILIEFGMIVKLYRKTSKLLKEVTPYREDAKVYDTYNGMFEIVKQKNGTYVKRSIPSLNKVFK